MKLFQILKPVVYVSKNIGTVPRSIISTNLNESRLNSLALYKAWVKSITLIEEIYFTGKTRNQMISLLRKKFRNGKHETDHRKIDILIIKVFLSFFSVSRNR
ncbi:hypothetical protein A3Q56_03397 [Intoshia linei]|uniref:Uncharacterized protein n=1 Tax=Intoshia linei TaxID=1819745 RepID=A0A177B580_9BILA|nr:hypothetical protein A3Q56_03397 [Intoshia linei]